MPKKLEIIIGVYAIVNKVNNKFYIGSSGHILRRFRQHKIDLKNNINHSYYLQRAVNKHGIENFEFKIIEIILDSTKLKEREQYWLDFYKPYLREYGYNTNPKSDDWTGTKHRPETIEKIKLVKANISDETRKRMSESMKGRPAHFKGKHHTDETKNLLREAHLGIIRTTESKQKQSIAIKGTKRGLSNGNGKYSDELLCEAIEYSFSGFKSKEVASVFGINHYQYNAILQGAKRIYVYKEFIRPRLDKGERLTIR